jgi:UDP-4-amino-4,6-dideoxy-N-acetyl-beta-L-altrosamine transaminase
LRSDWLTQGPAVPHFENTVSQYCGADHAVAICNATAALHLACMALDLHCGDILWTSPNTFVATANCALYCRAIVDFVDIDPRTYNMSVDALRKKLEDAEKNGRLPKILVTVQFAGQSCEMRDVKVLAERYGFRIIEDASHAIGGKYLRGPVGSCRYSDVTIFSFHPVKVITTGEGGMAVTNSAAIAERIRLLRSHGVTRNPARMLGESEGDWYYEQIELGYNYRMTDIQAALGSSQMSRLDTFVQRRHELAAEYDRELDIPDVIRPWQHPDMYSAFHLYPIRLQERKYGRREVFDRLRAAGIGVNVHYIPVHLQPHYRKLGFKEGDFGEAERYYREAISLPMFAGLTEEQQVRVIAAFKDALQ